MENQHNNEEKKCVCPNPWAPCHGKDCKNCWHEKWYGRKYAWLRWLLGIIILLVVFALGVKVGEFKNIIEKSYENDFAYGMHCGRNYYRYPMMFDERESRNFGFDTFRNQNFSRGMMGKYWDIPAQNKIDNENAPTQ